MHWPVSAFLMLSVLFSSPALANTQSEMKLREAAMAEAMSHADRITTEFPQFTIIIEISGGALTNYCFTKPGNPHYPAYSREKLFPGGKIGLATTETDAGKSTCGVDNFGTNLRKAFSALKPPQSY